MLSKTAREAKEGFEKTMEGILAAFREAADAMLKGILTTEGILRCLLPADFVFGLQVSESESIGYKWNVLEREPADPLEGVMSGLVYVRHGDTYPWGNPIPRELADVGKLRTIQVESETDYHKMFQYCSLDELAIVAENLAALVEGIWSSLPERPDPVASLLSDLKAVKRRSRPLNVVPGITNF